MKRFLQGTPPGQKGRPPRGEAETQRGSLHCRKGSCGLPGGPSGKGASYLQQVGARAPVQVRILTGLAWPLAGRLPQAPPPRSGGAQPPMRLRLRLARRRLPAPLLRQLLPPGAGVLGLLGLG